MPDFRHNIPVYTGKEEKMKTSFLKRLTAGILSFIILMSAVNFSVFADFVIGTDSGKQKLYVSYFNSYYDFGGTNGTSVKGSIIKLNKNSATGDIAYCIDIRTHAPNTSTQTIYEGVEWKDYKSLDAYQKRDINYAIMYGYIGTQKYKSYGCTANDERIATQIVIWNIVEGWFNNKTYEEPALNKLTQNINSADNASATKIKLCYGYIKKQILNHLQTPSFKGGNSKSTTRKVSGTSVTYSASFTDEKSCVSNFDWKTAISNAGLSSTLKYSISNNVITFTSSEPVNVTLKAYKTKGAYCSSFNKKRAVAMVSGDFQPTVGFRGGYDPVPTTVTLNTNYGNLTTTKTWSHNGDKTAAYTVPFYLVSYVNNNTTYYLTGSGSSGNYIYSGTTTDKNEATKFRFASSTTNKNTSHVNDLPARSYTVTEYGTNKFGGIDKYTRVKSNDTVTVTAGGNAYATLINIRNIGDLVVTKTWVHNSNSLISYATYKNSSGLKIAKYNNGKNAVTFRIYYKDSSGNKHYLKADDGSKIDDGVYKWNGTTTTTNQQYFHLYQNYYTGSNKKKYDGFKVVDMPTGYAYFVEESAISGYVASSNNISVSMTSKIGKDDYSPVVKAFKNTRDTGSAQIIKTWVHNGDATANYDDIYFTVKNKSTNAVIKGTTTNTAGKYTFSSNGSVSQFKLNSGNIFAIEGLPTGTYTVTEHTVSGYTVDSESKTVTISKGQTGKVSFKNTRDTGSAQITKVWVHNGDATADYDDIYFTVKNKSTNAVIKGVGGAGTYTFSASGSVLQFKLNSDNTFTLAGLPTGTYTVTEHTVSGYTVDSESKDVKVSKGQTGTVTFKNTRNTGTAQVIKTWIHHNDAKQADKDIYFVIKNNDTGKFITASGSAGNYTFTGANATAVAKATQLKLGKVAGVANGAFNVLNIPEGSYTAYEYGSNAYYTSVSGTSKSFKVVNGKVATVSFSNERNIGDLIVSKTWVHNGNSLISYQSTESLPYAILNGTPIYFKVYYETTDANGTVTRHYLKADDGNIPNEGVYKWSGETATASQQYFKLYKDYYTESGVKHDGFKIIDMPTGYTYYVEEQTVKGYICSSNKISVTITSKVGNDAYTPVKKDVRNTRETGSASLHKVFSDDANLTAQQKAEQYKNTTFAVLYKGNNQYVKATGSNGAYTFSGYQTTATEFALNASGNFSISNLPSGSYRVVEIKWDSYNYNPKTTYVDITVENGKNTPVNFENIRTGYVLVKKNWTIPVGLDRSTKRITDLTKNTYFLIRDKSTNQYLTATTDNQSRYTYTGVTTKANATKFNAYVYIENNDISSISFSVNKLPLGNYVVEEITTGDANKYFIPDKTSIDITLTNAVPTNDSSFTNTEKGCATINKVWSDAGTGYATDAERNAVTFYIRNKATNVYIKASGSAGDYTFTGLGTTAVSSGTGFKLSSSNTFLVKDLDAGTYIVSEVLAGSSKFAPRDEQEVTVANGEDNGVTFQNVVKAGALKVNKTWKAEVNTQANLQNLTSKVYFTLKFGNKYVVATKETNPAYRYKFANFTADASKATKFTASVITQNGALVATFDVAGLPIGSYTVTETVTDKNVAHRFTASALSANVNVTYNATATANFTNSESTGEIIKIWDDKNANTTEQERSKVQFVIKDTKTNKYIIAKQYATGDYEYTGFGTTDIASATLISLNANHTEAKITKLPEGTYTVIEMNCPSGYTASADQTLTIINGKLGTVKFTNTRDTGRLFIRKQWLSYKNLSADKLTELSNNTYFTIACGGNYVQASNSNGVYSFTGYTTSVSNATQFKAIIVKDSTGKVTDNKFNVTGLPTENYTIKEYTVNGSEANTNYIASSESQNITITKSVNNSTNSTKFINTEKGKANVTKTFTKKLNGTAFTDAELIALYGKVTFTVKKGTQYVTATGDNGNYVYSSLSNTAYTFKLSSTGKLAIENIPAGAYTITESCSDGAYKPTTATKSFTVANGKITSVAFENLPVVGEVLVTKVINGNLTAVDKANITTYYNNVKFKVKDTSTGKYVTATGGTSGTYYYSGNTDATGTVFSLNSSHKFAITRMPEGTYVAIEVSHSDGFNKAPDQTFTIKNGERTSLTFTNTREVASLTIKKVWKTSEENTLTTAEKQNLVNNIYFTVQDSGGNYVIAPKNSAGEYVYSSTNATLSNNGKFKLDVATNNILIKNLPTGTYTVKEVMSGKINYTADALSKTVKVIVNQNANATFTNTRDIGSLSIVKNWIEAGVTPSTDKQKEYNEHVYFTLVYGDKYVVATGSNGSYKHSRLTTNESEATHFVISTATPFKCNISELPTGNYTIHEYCDIAECEPSTPTQIKAVTKNVTATVQFKNYVSTYLGKVTKRWVFNSSFTSEQRRELIEKIKNGIYFTVKDEDNNYLKASLNEELEDGTYYYDGTTTNGNENRFYVTCTYDSKLKEYVSAFNIEGLPQGKYTVEEHNTLPAYKEDSSTGSLVMTGDADGSVTFTNRETSIVVSKRFSDGDNLTAEQLKAQYKKVTARFKIIGANGKEDKTVTNYGKYLTFSFANDIYTYSGVAATAGTANTDLKLTDEGKLEANFKGCPSPYYLMVEELYDSTSYVGTTGSNIVDCGTYTDVDYTVDNSNRVDLTNINVAGKPLVMKDITLNNKLNTGSIYIDKSFLDVDNTEMTISDEQLSKVTFKAYNSNGEELTFTKASNGNYNYTGSSTAGTEIKLNYDSSSKKYCFLLDKLPANERYTVAETKGSDYFTFDVDPVTFVITPNGKAKQVFYNKAMTGNVKIVKKSTNNVIEGFEFTLSGTSHTGKTVNVTGKTGKDGILNFENLRVGNYVITETKTGKAVGYITEKDKSVTVSYDSDKAMPVTTTVEFLNKAYGSVEISKKDSVTKELLTGATFGIYSDAECTIPAKAYKSDTDATLVNAVLKENPTGSGIFTCDLLPIDSDKGTTYYVKELTAPKNYALDTTVHDVTLIVANSVVKETVENTPKGSVYTKKFDRDHTDRLLSGATFTLYKSDKKTVVGTLTETAKGEYKIEEILAGTYYLQETKAPAFYERDNNFYKVVITDAGKTVTVETKAGNGGVPNAPMTGTISIVKTSTNKQVQGFAFRVTGTSKTGDAYDKTFLTDANGKIVIKDLRIGDYTVTEVKNNTTVGYIAETSKNVELTQDSTKTVPFENVAYGGLSVEKVDKVTGNPVTGATFGIYTDINCTITAKAYKSATDDTLVNAVFTTDGTSGKYNCNFLPINSEDGTTYYVKELTAPKNYVLDKGVYSITLDKPNEIKAVSNNNTDLFVEVPYGHVEIKKHDAERPDVKLSGAVFKIFDSNSETASVVGTLTEESKGTYTYKNLSAGTYYVQETEAPEYYERDTKFYKVVIAEAGKTITVENDDTGFGNKPMKGSISIDKSSADGKIEGFEFEVSGTALNGAPVATKTYKTDANGRIEIDDLLIGNYTIKEVKSNITSGYILPDGKTISVKRNNTTDVSMQNIPFGHIKIEKVNAKTGDKIANAQFAIFTDADCTIPAKAYKSDTDSTLVTAVITETAKGIYTCDRLPINSKNGTTYYVKETKAPTGYYIDEEIHAVVLTDADAVVNVHNNDNGKFVEYPYGHANIKKAWILNNIVADDESDALIEQLNNKIYFTLQDESGKYVTATKNAHGTYSYKEMSNNEYKFYIVEGNLEIKTLPTGKYKVTEHSSLSDYTINTANPVTIEVKLNETAQASFTNERDTGSLLIQKKWEHPVPLTKEEIAELEKHVTFTVKTADGKYVATKTDEETSVISFSHYQDEPFYISLTDSQTKIEKVPTGAYSIEEHSDLDTYKELTPVINKDIIKDTTANATFTNVRLIGNANLKKAWKYPTELSADEIKALNNEIYFTLESSEGGFVKVSGKAEDGEYQFAGLSETAQQIKIPNGNFIIKNLPTATYTATEVTSNGEYKNSNETQVFTTEADETYYLSFENVRKTGTTEMYKEWILPEGLDESEKTALINSLETNVTFTIQDSNNKYLIASDVDDSKYRFIGVQDTNDNTTEFALNNSRIEIIDLPTGTYTVTEHNKNKAYLMENEVQTITVKDEQASQLTFTNRAIKGSVSTTKKDADYPDVKLTGAIFTVYKAEENGYVEIGTLDEIKEGEYQLDNLYYGDYKLIETKAPEKFVRDTKEYKFSIDENSDGVVINIETEAGKGFENQPYRGTVRVTKIDKDYPENKLTGAEFTIYAEDKTTVIGTLTETKKGVYTYEDLRFGNYYLKETVAPENFILDNKFHSFKIEEDGEIVDVETKAGKGLANSAMTGTLNITKKSADGVIEGWKFRITSVDVPTLPEGVSYDETFTTDAEGKISVTLRIGTYKVEEVTTGVTGYLFPDAKDIEIKWNEDTDTEMENTPYGKIVLNKVDEFKNDVLVSGAVYAVYKDVNENGAYDEDVDTFVDNLNDENGIYSLDKVKYGKYIVKETKSPEGYLLDNNAYPVDINEANAERHIYNTVTDDGTSIYIEEVVTGTVQVTKVDKDYPENKLTGAEFTIYASDKTTVIGTLTETEKGIYTYEGLRYGNYFLKETKAPENFVLDEDFHAFSITEDGKIVDVETKAGKGLENSAMTGTLNITKKSADGVIEGWKFRITSVDVPTLPEGVSYDETFTTDAEGKISVTLRIGTYKVEEVTTGVTGYLFPDAKDIEIKWNEDTDTEMENTPYGKIVLNKVDEFNTITYVAGAVYAVYKDVNGNKTYEEEIDTFVSNLNEVKKGVYVLDKAEYGNYLVKEVKAPKGYLVDKNYYPISIGEAGAEVPVFNEKEKDTDAPIFVETPITGNVEITKVDEDYPDEKLSGAEFTIFEKDKKTEVGKLTEVEKGVYRYEGLRYGEYYLQETKAPKYFIRDVNFYYFEIVNNGETVTIANDELGKGTFINSPEAGEIKIVKTSYNNKVDGFTFEIKGTAYTGQEYCEQFITDKNGIISVKGLRAGRYTIHEVRNEATKGYILPADEELTIERLGDVAVANMYNGDNPKTGVLGDDNVLPIATFAAFVGTGIILITPTAKRKRKYRVIRTHKK